MGLRCGRARGIFDAWQAAATGQLLHADYDLSTVAPFIAPTFGLPPTGGSIDHVQGHVAEIAWRMLTKEEKLRATNHRSSGATGQRRDLSRNRRLRDLQHPYE